MSESSDELALAIIKNTILCLKDVKPNDRSERDRVYAVAITEIEKAYAYFKTFVVDA